MWPKFVSKILVVLTTLHLAVVGMTAMAQDVTPTLLPTETPTLTPTVEPTVEVLQISVSGLSPTEFTEGTGGTLTINGSSFTAGTTVSLDSSIALTVTSQTTTNLTVEIGAGVAAGTYTVVVDDPTNGTTLAPTTITVNAMPTETPTPTTTSIPQISVTHTEPSRITQGTSTNLSILGSNFTSDTTVRLVGFGFLTVTYINNGAITAALPTNIPTGTYTIEVADPVTGTVQASSTLRVVAVSTTSTPTPTPTAIPGEPELVVNTFYASPSNIYPGETTVLTIEVRNVGSRPAQGVVISLNDETFTPANGQASVSLPDMGAGASYTTSLSVTASAGASEGPQNVSLVITSHDFSGQSYTDNASVSVTVLAETDGDAQILLDSYSVNPEAAVAGDTVTVQALFTNTGTETAEQVLVTLDESSGVLLAGVDGNAYSLGNMTAGAVQPLVMSYVVGESASEGVQSQSFTITYVEDGEVLSTSASISLSIDEEISEEALLLLESYSVGETELLEPGQQFSLEMTLGNAGGVDVSELMVTFGSISESGSDDATTVSTSVSTTTSSNFAIYGSGGTQVLGDLASGDDITLTQAFIVSSDLGSGIQSLPVTLQYLDANGTEIQEYFELSILVVEPPRLRIIAENELDDVLTVGEEYTIVLEISNLGSTDATLTELRTIGENVEIAEGAEILLDPLQSDDDTSESISFTPQEAGDYTITVEIDYIDDLNRTETIVEAFNGTVEEEQEQRREPMGGMPPTTETTEDASTIIGRLLLGFLGFGG